MTATAVRPIGVPVGGASKKDMVALLTFYVFLLMAIPSSLVFAPFGGAVRTEYHSWCGLLRLVYIELASSRFNHRKWTTTIPVCFHPTL